MNQQKSSSLLTAATLVVGFAVLAALYKAFVPFSLVYNSTASIPKGIYLAKEVQGASLTRGDTACFAYSSPPWAQARAYFPEGRRLCKYVLGLPGDVLEVSEGVLTVTHKGKEHPGLEVELAKVDSKGRELPQDALSSGGIPEGRVLMLGPEHKNSLDSRYLGLVPLSQLKHQLWPVFTHK